MKKALFVIASLLMFSCSKKEEKQVEDTSSYTPEPKKEIVEGNKSLPGYALITGSDCLSCHKDNEVFVGPSYAEIAKKYTDKDLELLATKIIEGGSGAWGQVPMQAHPQITKDQAKQMVQYILSVKK